MNYKIPSLLVIVIGTSSAFWLLLGHRLYRLSISHRYKSWISTRANWPWSLIRAPWTWAPIQIRLDFPSLAIMVRSNTRGGGLLTSSWRYVLCQREFSNQGQIWIEGAGTPADCAGRAMNLVSILTPSRKGELEGNSKVVWLAWLLSCSKIFQSN